MFCDFLKTDVNVPTESNMSKKLGKKLIFCWHLERHWRKRRIRIRIQCTYGSNNPDPSENVMDPEHCQLRCFFQNCDHMPTATVLALCLHINLVKGNRPPNSYRFRVCQTATATKICAFEFNRSFLRWGATTEKTYLEEKQGTHHSYSSILFLCFFSIT